MCSQRVHEHDDVRRPLFWGRGSSGSGGLRRESRFRQSSTAFQQLSDVIKFSCGLQAAILRVPEELLWDSQHDHGWVSNSHCDHGGGDSHCRYCRRGSGQIDQVNDKSFMGHWKFCDGFKHVQTCSNLSRDHQEIMKNGQKNKATQPSSHRRGDPPLCWCQLAEWRFCCMPLCAFYRLPLKTHPKLHSLLWMEEILHQLVTIGNIVQHCK